MIAHIKTVADRRGREFELSEEQIAEVRSSVTAAALITDQGMAKAIYFGRPYRLEHGNPDLARHINDFLSLSSPRH